MQPSVPTSSDSSSPRAPLPEGSGPSHGGLRTAILGGGISGLAAAHRLAERHCGPLTLFEGSNRVGGVLETVNADGFQVELGSDSFVTNRPWALDLCRRIGFERELVGTNDRFRRTYVVRAGKLAEVPEGFVLMRPTNFKAVLTTPILSWAGKLRLAGEWFVPPRRESTDESLASFVRRRLGREVFERLVQPLVGGIYTADAERLSLAATLPQFLDMERTHGGLLRSVLAAPPQDERRTSGARYGLFLTPRRGLGSLVETLAARLPPETIRTGARITTVEKTPAGTWTISGERHGKPFREVFDAVVCALPAPAAAPLCRAFDPRLADELAGIPYAGAAVVSLGVRLKDFARPPRFFGFVVPQIENRRILACSCSSVKFPGRAPDEHVLLRVFVGGAGRPDLVDADDADLAWIVRRELGDLLGLRGTPVGMWIARYGGRMPQYHVGHLDRVARIERQAELHAGFALAGNAYRGVGIPDCIRSGEQAADSVLTHLDARRAG